MDTLRTLVKQHPGDVNAGSPTAPLPCCGPHIGMIRAAVDALLAAGANVNASNRDGIYALSQACTNGNARMVAALLKAGADANPFRPKDRPF